LEQMREVKVVIFFGWKVCNPFAEKVKRWRERTSDVRFNGKRTICKRSLLRSVTEHVRLREVMLVNLCNR
jgi:hypothetical protein